MSRDWRKFSGWYIDLNIVRAIQIRMKWKQDRRWRCFTAHLSRPDDNSWFLLSETDECCKEKRKKRWPPAFWDHTCSLRNRNGSEPHIPLAVTYECRFHKRRGVSWSPGNLAYAQQMLLRSIPLHMAQTAYLQFAVTNHISSILEIGKRETIWTNGAAAEGLSSPQ